jgi:hypothetical protein
MVIEAMAVPEKQESSGSVLSAEQHFLSKVTGWSRAGKPQNARGLLVTPEEPAEFLKKLIGDQQVTFLSFGGKGKRPRGTCYAGETFVQEAMVRNGWAVSGHSATELAQLIAQENRRYLFSGSVQ